MENNYCEVIINLEDLVCFDNNVYSFKKMMMEILMTVRPDISKIEHYIIRFVKLECFLMII